MFLVNAYLLSFHSDPHNTERFTNQKSFRESVFQALFAKSERAKRKRSYQTYVTEQVESEEPHVRGVLREMENVGDVGIVGKCGRFWVRGTQIPSSFSGRKEPVMDARCARFLFAKKGRVGKFFMERLLREHR